MKPGLPVAGRAQPGGWRLPQCPIVPWEEKGRRQGGREGMVAAVGPQDRDHSEHLLCAGEGDPETAPQEWS